MSSLISSCMNQPHPASRRGFSICKGQRHREERRRCRPVGILLAGAEIEGDGSRAGGGGLQDDADMTCRNRLTGI
jgi:hypothetical protein